MARIKKFAGDIPQGLSSVQTFLVDDNPNSDYFRITEFKDTFTGGKNGFLIEGSPYLKETTEVKIEILDVEGNTVYYEPGDGIPEYYEGLSKVISVYIYEDTPIGIAKITILGELKQYLDGDVVRNIPDDWNGLYNVKWEREFKVNKNLTNEDKVRFYRRPSVAITEIARPIFTATAQSITQTGNVLGTPIIPPAGTNINQFPRPSQYLLTTLGDSRWTGSVVDSTIVLDGSTILNPLEVVSDTELIVSTPYTENSIVTSFDNKPYSTTFNYIQNDEGLGTALSGSFGKFVITNLETFVGDVHRIKVFRTSQSDLTDFQFVQEIVLESTEILIDYEQSQRDEESYGLFTPFILDEYWELSSANITKEFNQSFLFNSVKLDSTGENTFSTINNVSISNGIEYTLSFNTRIPEVTSGDFIEVYLQGTKDGTTKTQSIGTINSSSELLQKSLQSINFIGDDFDDVKLYFNVKGNNWYVSTVSLRAAQETSFSPDEITFIQTVPRTLPEETFDFRFEFYDINNNYIPVTVVASKTFSEGNLNEINKAINIVPTSLYFQFDSGSQQGNAIPPKTIFLDVEKEFLTGSVTWTSASYDNENNLIPSGAYSSTFYPGLLEPVTIGVDEERYRLTVENFSGSLYDTVVQYVEYTAEAEGVSDTVVITRVSDGKGGVNFEIRPYRGTIIRNSDPTSSIEIQAVRIDGINEVNLRADLPLDYSIPLLYITSASVEGDISYVTLEQASSSGYVTGISAGTTGSGEINYNASFNRDAIDGQRTVYLIPSNSPTSESILTSLTLTDLQDGLNTGEILFSSDTFTVDAYPSFQNPSLARTFNPSVSKVTGSFFRRGQTTAPVSGTMDIYPSMSVSSDYIPEFWLYYETGAFNEDISVVVQDENENIIQPHDPFNDFDGSIRSQHKQLSVTFTYNEPFTTASVSVEKTFNISPDGKGGDDAIVIEIDPKSVTLNADESRFVDDYSPTITEIKIKQGNDEDNGYLTYSETKTPGTFYINEDNVIASNITFNGFSSATDGIKTVITTEHSDMTVSSTTKQATVVYPIEIRPYFTSSYYTASVSQSIIRVDEGAGARGLTLTADTNTVTYNGDGNIVEPAGDITLTAEAFNTTGSGNINFYFYKDNNFIDVVNQNSTLVTKAIPSSEFPAGGTIQTYRVELHDGNADINATANAIASTTIQGIQDGTPNYQAVVTNQNATMFVDVYENKVMDNTSTTIEVYKGQTQLTHVGSGESYGFPTFDDLGNVIPNGKYRVSIHSFPSSYLDISGSLVSGSILPTDEDGNAYLGPLDDWTNFRNLDGTPNSASANIVFRVDFEDGRDSALVRQNLSVGYEGNVGPGLIMRGEWTGSLDYIFDVAAKRRDAVFREISGDVHYWATTIDLADAGSPPYTYEPVYTGTEVAGDIDANGWQYLGVQDFFVAAKLAIFEESFVKNTINVGNNPGNEFANIVIAGGRVDPYLAIGQNGTVGSSGNQIATGVIGYDRPGIFMGTFDDNPQGTSGGVKTPRLSLRSETDGNGSYRSLLWDGDSLFIRGAITQTSDGTYEGRVLGAWDDLPTGFSFLVNDVVVNDTITWECILAHNKDVGNDEPGVGSNYTTYWQESNLASQTLRLSADTQIFRKAKDGTITPSYIAFTANKQNIASNTSWSTSPAVDLYTDATGGSTSVTGDDTVFLRIADFGSNTSVKVTATAGLFSDEITVVLLEEGSDAITVINTNQSHTLPSDGDGVVSSYAGSGTTISVYEGTNKLEYDGTGTNAASWSLSSSIIPPGVITVGGVDGIDISGKDALVNDHSSMSDGASTVLIDYDITGKRINGESFTTETTQTITKASNAKTLRLSADPLTFKEAKDGTVSPDYITLVANKQNTTVSTTWSTDPSVDLYTDPTGGSTSVNGDNTVFLRKADFGTNTAVTVTATAGTLSDDVTIVRLIDGGDAVVAVLSNETHTIPAAADGTVDSGDYGGSGTKIFVYEGTTLLDYDGSGATEGHWTVAASGDNIDEGSIGQSGDIAVVNDHSNFATLPLSASVTYTITGKKFNGDSFSLEKVQTFSKAKTGNAGENGRGILFRGEWDSNSVDYFKTDTRQDVVKYSTNTTNPYWLCRVTHTSTAGNHPPNSGATSTTEWESFGATFSSVATDILFAQEVYADKTVFIGTEGESNLIVLDAADTSHPFISIGQGGSRGYSNDGIFAGFDSADSTAKLSIKQDGTGLFFDGSDLTISGSIENNAVIIDNLNVSLIENNGKVRWLDGTLTEVASIQGTSSPGAGALYIKSDDWLQVGDYAINRLNLRGDYATMEASNDVAITGIGGDVIIKHNATGKIQLLNSQLYYTNVAVSNTGITFVLDPSGSEIFLVDGNIAATGNITAYASSDKRLKLNIKPLENSLDKILKIGGYSFDWDETKQKDFQGYDVGVIAQEIQEVLPEVVTERKDGYLAVRYEKIVPLLIESIKELSEKVRNLEEKLKDK